MRFPSKSVSILLLFPLVFLSSIDQSHAGLVLDFSIDGGTTFGNRFDVQEGSETLISIFLSQTDDTTTLTDDGLFGFGLHGDLLTTNVGAIFSSEINPAFDFQDTNEFTDRTIDWEGFAVFNDIPTGEKILLGEFGFRSSGVEEANFAFGDLEPGSGSANVNWLSGANEELDEVTFGAEASNAFQLTLNVSAVPEPGAAGLLLLIGIPLALRRNRLRF